MRIRTLAFCLRLGAGTGQALKLHHGSLRTPAAIRLACSHILSSVMLKPTSTLVE
jgi:hypothetical protein